MRRAVVYIGTPYLPSVQSVSKVPVVPADSCQSIDSTCKKISQEVTSEDGMREFHPTNSEKLFQFCSMPKDVA